MIVSIHQPSYFPWLQLLNKINQSDLYVLLDTVQLSDSLYQHRNLFLDSNGSEHILTIPIERKGYLDSNIKDIRISQGNWQKKHSRFLFFNYKKHDYFDEIFPLLQPIYEKKYQFLVDALVDAMTISFGLFGIETEVVRSSSLDLNHDFNKEQHVLDILRAVEGKTYISGQGAKSYQDEKNFLSRNIRLIYQEFDMPKYKQKNTSSFNAELSCLDVLFNLGKEDSHSLITEDHL